MFCLIEEKSCFVHLLIPHCKSFFLILFFLRRIIAMSRFQRFYDAFDKKLNSCHTLFHYVVGLLSRDGIYYKDLSNKLLKCETLSDDIVTLLYDSLQELDDQTMDSDEQTRYSRPMPWIGLYIALASLICTLAVVADLLHMVSETENYGSLVNIPLSMGGYVDQAAKLGSLAFMCTMMTNSLPSLATMGSKELHTNI